MSRRRQLSIINLTLIIASTSILFIILLSQTTTKASAELLQADRSEIKLRRSTDETSGIVHELLISGTNITALNVVTADLFDEQEQRRFQASNIVVVPKTFDIKTTVDSGTKMLDITINTPGVAPGVYVGKLYIINPSTQFTIPIILTIHYPIWVAVLLIIIGVIVGFIVKLATKLRSASSKVKEEARAKGWTDQQVEAHAMKTTNRMAFALKETVGKSPWVYVGVSALIFVGVLSAIQGYYSNLVAFGRSPIDLIAAFTFGFGGNAILNQAIELIKK